MLSLGHLADLRQRRVRDAHGHVFIEGLRFLICALKTRQEILGVVVVPHMLASAEARRLVKATRAPVLRITAAEYARISLVDKGHGIGAIIRQRWATLTRPRGPVTWLAFERVRSAGNLGTTLRTGAAAGVAGALFLGRATDPFDPGAVRASMGALFHQQVVRSDAGHLRAWKRRTGALVVGASGDARLDYRAVSYRRPVMLMLGDEREGLSARQRAVCDRVVRIPMHDVVDSLNLAVAASLLIYEVYRQRHP